MARPASDRWVDMEEIGGGAYGVVFRARDRRKKTFVDFMFFWFLELIQMTRFF